MKKSFDLKRYFGLFSFVLSVKRFPLYTNYKQFDLSYVHLEVRGSKTCYRKFHTLRVKIFNTFEHNEIIVHLSRRYKKLDPNSNLYLINKCTHSTKIDNVNIQNSQHRASLIRGFCVQWPQPVSRQCMINRIQ